MQSSKPLVQFAFSKDKEQSNYAQAVSEESWGPCCAQPAFQAKLTGGIWRKLCRTGQIADISPNRPINLWRNLRIAHPKSWGSPSHIFNDHIIHIPKVKKYPSNQFCLALCFLLLQRRLQFCVSDVKFDHIQKVSVSRWNSVYWHSWIFTAQWNINRFLSSSPTLDLSFRGKTHLHQSKPE